MSFVNLLANDVWTDADITRRTEAMVHSVTPVSEEVILTRKVMAAGMGQWTLTDAEQAELATYAQACNAAHQAGLEARADMALLQSVLDYEAALLRIEWPDIDEVDSEGVVVNQDAIDADIAERETAVSIINAASPATLDLYDLRHPAPESDPDALV